MKRKRITAVVLLVLIAAGSFMSVEAAPLYPTPLAQILSGSGISQDTLDLLTEYDICIYQPSNYKNFPDIKLPVPETVVNRFPGSIEGSTDEYEGYVYYFSSERERLAYASAYLGMIESDGHTVTGISESVNKVDTYYVTLEDTAGYALIFMKEEPSLED